MDESHEQSATVIIPTLNEAENLDPLLRQIFTVARQADLEIDVVIADGGSSDGTQAKALEWAGRAPVRLVQCPGEGGLAGDVLAAARECDTDIVVVMDADLSHPPKAIPELLQPLLDGTHDMVSGSRYIPGGGTPGWPWSRRMTSRAATLLVWPLVSVHDPMSGFFAVRRDRLLSLGEHATGFKIGLELLARGGDTLRVCEVPITFVDRERGQTKMGMLEAGRCLSQISALFGGTASTGHAARFLTVGFLGLLVDLTVFNILLALGLDLLWAHTLSFLMATLSNFTLNASWVFRENSALSSEATWKRYSRFLVVAVLAWILRGAVLMPLVESLGWAAPLAILPAILAATFVNYFGITFFVFQPISTRTNADLRWRIFALAIVGYSIVMRIALAGMVDLLPEEAYYWCYAQRPSLGYFDHPPMVGWLIWLSTALLGNSEWAVRVPALGCWFITAIFAYRLANDFAGKTNALRVVMLVAIFPIYFSVGFLTTPDAPLYAAWAGSLYYLSQALIRDRSKAWFGIGVCLGLGMLSKYTIALLGPATLAYIILDKDSRAWLRRPEPYLAVLMTISFFTPVLLWNAEHHWASFLFQGPRRWANPMEFSLHQLVLSVFLLLTPIGAIGAAMVLWPSRWGGFCLQRVENLRVSPKRFYAFSAVFTLVPLSVFVLHSLQDNPKLNWTGPVWLAVLPLLALTMITSPGQIMNAPVRIGQRLWKPVAVGMMVLFGIGIHAVATGPPLLPGLDRIGLPVAWEEMMYELKEIERNTRTRTSSDTAVASLHYFYSAEFAFYDPSGRGMDITAGSGLFGAAGLMWDYWIPPKKMVGSTLILVDFDERRLSSRRIEGRFSTMDEIRSVQFQKNGHLAGQFYYRIGYGYHLKEEEVKLAHLSADIPSDLDRLRKFASSSPFN